LEALSIEIVFSAKLNSIGIMRKMIAIAMIICVAGFSNTFAQDAPNRQGYQETTAEDNAKAMTDKMMEYVPDISKEQWGNLYQVNLQYIIDARALASHPGTSDEKVKLNTDLRKKRELAVKEILTEDQFARLDEGMKQVPKRP
jgi:hypothetical protein